MAYRLRNASIRIQLPVPQNVTLDIWVDANTDAVRVASSSDTPHKLEATLEIWRNRTGPYSWVSPIDQCPSEGEVFVTHPDTVDWQGTEGRGASDAETGVSTGG